MTGRVIGCPSGNLAAINFRDVYVRCGKGQYVQGRVVHKSPAGMAWRPSPERLPEDRLVAPAARTR